MEELRSSRAYKSFENFKKINQIPRCSNNEQAISDYLYELGLSMGLETTRDEFLNVIIRKPARPGFEGHPGVCLQGHMDMVCEKEETSNHDFCKDPIDMYIDGDYIKARGTTLGADDAIGVSMALDILESKDVGHPDLEVLITSTEETGMDGVMGLKEDALKSRRLINIDAEDEGIMIIGCAGGIGATFELPLTYQNQRNLTNKKIVISGLKGGHSGLTIGSDHLNAIKLMSNFISKIRSKDQILLQNLSAGTKHNAIPAKAEAILGIREEDYEDFIEDYKREKDEFISQYLKREPQLTIELVDAPEYDVYLSNESAKAVFTAINLLPHGINSMVLNDETMVESSNNLAIARVINDFYRIDISIRSSNEDEKISLMNKIEDVSKLLSAGLKFSDGYPMWEPDFDSELCKIAEEAYKSVSGEELSVKTIHAGLETGIIAKKYPGMDMISIGPEIIGAHTPEEKLSISSTERTRDFLVEILSRL